MLTCDAANKLPFLSVTLRLHALLQPIEGAGCETNNTVAQSYEYEKIKNR